MSGTAAPVTEATLSASSIWRSARALVQLDADRNLSVTNVEFGKVGADVADGGDTHRLGDGFRGNPKLGGDLGVGGYPQLRPVEFGAGNDIGDEPNTFGLAGQLGGRLRHGRRVASSNDELELALPVVLQKPVADIGHGAQTGADLQLQLAL